METEDREQREWWCYLDQNVTRVTAYAREPRGVWWCPELGYTLSEGFQLFNREDEALRLAIRDTDQLIMLARGRRARWQERLTKLG